MEFQVDPFPESRESSKKFNCIISLIIQFVFAIPTRQCVAGLTC